MRFSDEQVARWFTDLALRACGDEHEAIAGVIRERTMKTWAAVLSTDKATTAFHVISERYDKGFVGSYVSERMDIDWYDMALLEAGDIVLRVDEDNTLHAFTKVAGDGGQQPFWRYYRGEPELTLWCPVDDVPRLDLLVQRIEGKPFAVRREIAVGMVHYLQHRARYLDAQISTLQAALEKWSLEQEGE
jgi:hypothetical protein